jgi:hypothetical protein
MCNRSLEHFPEKPDQLFSVMQGPHIPRKVVPAEHNYRTYVGSDRRSERIQICMSLSSYIQCNVLKVVHLTSLPDTVKNLHLQVINSRTCPEKKLSIRTRNICWINNSGKRFVATNKTCTIVGQW